MKINTKAVTVQVDHSRFGRSIGSGLLCESIVICHASILMPLCLTHITDKKVNDNFQSSIPIITNLLKLIDDNMCKNRSSKVIGSPIKFQTVIQENGCNKVENIAPCLVHFYSKSKQIFEEIINWDLNEDSEKNEDYEKVLTTLQNTFIFFMYGNHCKGMLDDVLKRMCKTSNSLAIYQGMPIVVESTPLGNLSFMNAWSHGIVSKIFNFESGGILIDARLVFGCEGAPIFMCTDGKKGELIGLVTQAISWCNGEWVGFSVGLSIKHLLEDVLNANPNGDFLPLSNLKMVVGPRTDLDEMLDCIVFVRCGHKWGSGVVIDANSGTILTCAHLVNHEPRLAKIKHKGEDFPASVVYSTPLTSPYDLAVLSVPQLRNCRQIQFAVNSPVLGERVLAAGYPLSTEHLVSLNPSPTLSAGIVSKTSSRGGPLQTTCCTQSGLSGGAVLCPPNQLLGIVVSNVRLNNTTLPEYSFAVCIQDVKQCIDRYLKSKDPLHLQGLQLENTAAKMEWALMDSKL